MFDQEDYYSDDDDNLTVSQKRIKETKQQVPVNSMDFSHLTGEGQSLLKMMKERGSNFIINSVDLTDNEVKKMKQQRQFKSKQKDASKVSKQKAGFFDGGHSASLQQLIKALKKALSHADPQQASCILSHILEKKNLSPEDQDKFGIMKCNLLFGLGAYEDCLQKSIEFLKNPLNKQSAAILSNLAAKSRGQLNQVLVGYYDFLRAKSLINEFKEELQTTGNETDKKKAENKQFADSELDTTIREISHTELEYNIKLSQLKSNTNLIHPNFPEFRHRQVLQISCGDYHALFLMGSPLQLKNQKPSKLAPEWRTEVFGVGENSVGQIMGRPNQTIYKEPVLISALSGKGIEGICATKQSSLAYDAKGNIYEWGVKQKRNDQINVTHSLGQKIARLEKGYKHYAVLTQSKTFFTWGTIQCQGKDIFNKPNPHLHTVKNIVSFSCGNNHVVVIEENGDGFAMGSNEFGQLGIEGENFAKEFKIINKNKQMSDLLKAFCLGDCTFFVNTDQEVFYCGKYSYQKQPQYRIRQAGFPEELKYVVNMSGSVGNYYLTDCSGKLYRWNVDSSVKFKPDTEETFEPRAIYNTRGLVFRAKTSIEPSKSAVSFLTKQLHTFEHISVRVSLEDRFGPYANKIWKPIRCQVFLSTHSAAAADLKKENNEFLQSLLEAENTLDVKQDICVSQIIEARLLSLEGVRNEEDAACFHIKMQVQRAGKYYFYVFVEKELVYGKEICIEVSEREQQLEQKSKQERDRKIEERRKRAEIEKQRLLEEKLRKEAEEQERKKQTQRRAEQALKKHLKNQEEQRMRQEDDRKRKADLQTGGGFDLAKLRRKSSEKGSNPLARTISSSLNLEKEDRSVMERTGESFLPDINARPSSKRKLNLPKPSEVIAMSRAEVKNELFSSKDLLTNDTPSTSSMSNGFKTQKTKSKLAENLISTNLGMVSTTGTTTTGRSLIKRGLSKGKKN